MVLEADNIELSFDDKRILYGVYLKAKKGEVTGILGRNGCGKTCLLRIIFGTLNSKYSNIRIDGAYQKRKLFRTGEVAYLPQHRLLPKNLKLSTAFRLFNVNWTEFVTIFKSFEIYKTSRANQLSAGELRVVEAFLILFSEKKMIFLDEPFSFIAPIYVEKFKKLIREKKRDSVIIITDHFYRDILEVSDSIYFLKNGYSKLIRSKKDLEDEGYLNYDE